MEIRTRIKKTIAAACCLVALAPFSRSAQLSAGLVEQVSAILAKFPASDAENKNQYAAELVALGRPGIEEVWRRLSAPGADDDTLARFALDAVALYTTRPGAESERQMFVSGLLKGLEAPLDAEVKTFLISELQIAGRAEIVQPLSPLLGDPELCGPAAKAMVVVGTPEAEDALFKAFFPVSTKTAGPLIKALGELRSRRSIPVLRPYASSSEEILREAALDALANIGDPESRPVLETIAVAASPYERAKAARRFLLYAQRLWESGETDKSAFLCRRFLDNLQLPEEAAIRASALSLLAKIRGEDILDDLLEYAGNPEREIRQKALELADSVPGEETTRRWLERMAQVQSEARADLIAMLGRRGDKISFPVVREEIKSGDKSVRLEAVAAAVKLGGAEVFADVWPLIQTEDEDQVRVVKQALLDFPSAIAVPKAVEILDKVPDAARVALIELLAERKAADPAKVVLAQALSQNDAVRKAALTALESLAGSEDLPRLTGLLLKTSAVPEITLIQNALVSAANRIVDPEKRADVILAALKKAPAPKRADLIKPLARIGGAKALRVVVAETKSKEARAQAAAVYALANWTDQGAIAELFTLAGSTSDKKTRYLALQGIGRLAVDPSNSADRMLAFVTRALEIATEPVEKNLAISFLAAIRTAEALKAAVSYLDQPAYQGKAAQSVVRLAMPSPGFAGLAGLETALALKKAIPLIESDYDREDAELYADELLLKEGFIPLFNGKNLAGWKGLVADPPKRAMMAPEETARAQAEADELMRRHWKVIESTLVFDGQGHSLCTSKDYADFELFVDWRIEPKGDSGIYLRGSPQVQIWDPDQNPEGSGGLYNNKTNPAKPLIRADRPAGQWNTFFIRMTGERVTVYGNGILVADNVVMENYWERDKPIYPTGPIELQAHSTRLSFKNIFIREIR